MESGDEALGVSWRVELEGNLEALQALANHHNSLFTTIVEQNNKHYLETSQFKPTDTPQEVDAHAKRIIEGINLLSTVELPGLERVRAGAVEKLTPGSEPQRIILGSIEGVCLRPKIGAVGIVADDTGALSDQPPSHTDRLKHILRDSNLREALEHYEGPTAVELYKCFEVIRKHATTHLNEQLSKPDKQAFTEFCQHQRHARYNGQRKGTPKLSLNEARALIRPALQAWLADKSM